MKKLKKILTIISLIIIGIGICTSITGIIGLFHQGGDLMSTTLDVDGTDISALFIPFYFLALVILCLYAVVRMMAYHLAAVAVIWIIYGIIVLIRKSIKTK